MDCYIVLSVVLSLDIWNQQESKFKRLRFEIINIYIYKYIRIGPGAVAVTTSGQHKHSTPNMLQIWFISNKKSQHLAMFKSVFFPLPLPKHQRATHIWMLHPTTSERAGWHESCYCLDFLRHDCLATAWQLLWQTSVQHILRSPTQISLVLSDRAQKCARAKKKSTWAQKLLSQPGFRSWEKTFSSAQKKLRDAPKSHLIWKTHEKPGDLGDLAKSTYNHLVTFDSRGT